MSELLARALAALGADANFDEVRLVANALRKSNDEEALALLDAASEGDRVALDALYAIATEAGAGDFVALDLATEYGSPGSQPRRSR
jgi:hypothetical protein